MKEQDIRKRDALNKYLELVRIDSERIFSDKSTFEEVDYKSWGCKNLVFEFEKHGFKYVRCTVTDTLFVNPRPRYDHLMEIYSDSPSTRFWVNEFFLPMVDARREKIFKPRAEYIAEKFPDMKKSKIADIGAGFGLFLEELKKIWPNADLTAIEPSKDMAKICRDKNLPVIESMVEHLDPNKYKYDFLTSFELFEHLHNPRLFLNKAYELLNRGGYLFLTTLNGLGFDIQVLWENSKSVSPPHHLNFFNPISIVIILNKVGFEVVEISTPGELDWDIVEGAFKYDKIDPGRFFKTISKYGSSKSKTELQSWIQSNNYSSHMRITAKKI